MSGYPSRIFRRSQPEAQGLAAHQPVRMRLAVQAMSSGQMSGRNLTVNGVGGSAWAAHNPASSYTAYTSAPVIHGGKQWVCINTIGPKAFDTADWWEVKPISWFRLCWGDETKRGGITVAQMYDAIKAANPAHLFCQYIYTVCTTFDTNYIGDLVLGNWATAGTNLLALRDNSDVPKRISRNVTLTTGSPVIPMADTSGIEVGMLVIVDHYYEGGIQAVTNDPTVVQSINPGVSVTLSKNATASGARTVVFHNFVIQYTGTSWPYLHAWNYRKVAEGATGPDGLTVPQKIVAALKAGTAFSSRRWDGWAFDDQYMGKKMVATLSASDPLTAAGDYTNELWGTDYLYGQGYFRPGQNEWTGDPDVLPYLHEFYRQLYAEFRKEFPTGIIYTNANQKVHEVTPGCVDFRMHEGQGKSYSHENIAANGWLQQMKLSYNEQLTSRRGMWGSAINGAAFYDPSATIAQQSDSRVGGIHQDMLYGLCTALLSDAFFAWNQEEESGSTAPEFHLEATRRLYIAEYDAELGAPIEPMPVQAHASGIWYRRYSNGIVLVNPRLQLTGDWSAGNSKTITLPTDRTYKRLTGTRNPADDGSVVTQITLACRRGLILLCG